MRSGAGDKTLHQGAPEFVIEILSPSSKSHDQVRKRRLYEKHGVKEYWVIDPEDRLVTVYRQQKVPSRANSNARSNVRKGGAAGGFAGIQILDGNGLQLDVPVLPGLTIDFTKIFPPMPKVVKQSPAPYL